MKKEYLSPEVELIDLVSMQRIANAQDDRANRDNLLGGSGGAGGMDGRESLGTGGDEMD